MTTGIGNEWDPGDPPEIHKEREREKRKEVGPIEPLKELARTSDMLTIGNIRAKLQDLLPALEAALRELNIENAEYRKEVAALKEQLLLADRNREDSEFLQEQLNLLNKSTTNVETLAETIEKIHRGDLVINTFQTTHEAVVQLLSTFEVKATEHERLAVAAALREAAIHFESELKRVDSSAVAAYLHSLIPPADQKALDAPLRCLTTGNPCGTDTRMAGDPCRCSNCRWLDAHDAETIEQAYEKALMQDTLEDIRMFLKMEVTRLRDEREERGSK